MYGDADCPIEGVAQGNQGLGSYGSTHDKNFKTIDVDSGLADNNG